MINQIVKKTVLPFGIITGIVSCLITTTIYVIDLNLFIKPWIGVFSIAVYIIIGIVLLSKTKKEIEGDFTFKDAFTAYFISAVVAILISTLFNIVLFNLIDPSAKETLTQITIKYTVGIMKKFGTPSSSINEAIKSMKENSPYDVGPQLKGMLTSIVFSAVFGLILAAFFKTRKAFQE